MSRLMDWNQPTPSGCLQEVCTTFRGSGQVIAVLRLCPYDDMKPYHVSKDDVKPGAGSICVNQVTLNSLILDGHLKEQARSSSAQNRKGEGAGSAPSEMPSARSEDIVSRAGSTT